MKRAKKKHTFCRSCQSEKPLEEMAGNKAYGLGYKALCRKCDAAESKVRREKDPELIAKKKKINYEKNRDKILAKKLVYTAKNSAKKSIYNYHYFKNRRLTDSFFRTVMNLRRAITRAIKRFHPKKTNSSWKILGTDREGLVNHFLKEQGIDIRIPEHIEGMHIDHICPLGQARDEVEAMKLNHYSNLQFLPKKINTQKANRKTYAGLIFCRYLLQRKWID